jgi:hypothetical protein
MTAVSCWQCGHHVAKISSNTGVGTWLSVNGPPVVETLKSGALPPTVRPAFCAIGVTAAFGTIELSATATTTATTRMPNVA